MATLRRGSSVAVLGAGALGLAAARRLAQGGLQVTLIEREPLVGGLATGFRVEPSWFEKFYHHIFRTDRRIIALIEEMGLGADLHWGSVATSILHDGRAYRLDGPLAVLLFPPLSIPSRLRLGAALALLKVLPSPRMFERQTAARWIRRWMGDEAYRVVWAPLLRGKFGDHAEEVSMPWFWARVYCRTPKLGYLRGGFQRLYEAMAEELRQHGNEVRLKTTVTSIGRADRQVVVATAAGPERFDAALVTLPTRRFLRLAEGLPSTYRERYERTGEHLSAHCLVLELDHRLQSSYWLNVGDPGYPFLALVEHTNLMPPEDYGGRHLVYLGNYLPPEAELFQLDPEAILERYLPHLVRINPHFQPSWVRKVHSFQAHDAQPIVRVGYPESLAPHRTPLDGVWLANMGHVYPQDRGQNYSIALGERIASQMLGEVDRG